MRWILTPFLVFGSLAYATSAWEATTSQNVQIKVSAAQTVASVSLSNNSFVGGAASGTVVGAVSVTLAPASPAFSGTLSLSGADASKFQIVGNNLETNGVVPAGTYNMNIVATETGVTNSPFSQAEAITASASSGGCPLGNAYQDGCPNSPAGSPQLPTLFTVAFAPHTTPYSLRPPWNVAWVDYHVGCSLSSCAGAPSGAPVGKDPTVAGNRPSGLSYNSTSQLASRQ